VSGRIVNKAVILRMSPDPEPQKAVGYLDSKSAVMQPDLCRPDRIKLLELKRGMSRIVFEKLK
jgi:hypothetical protein